MHCLFHTSRIVSLAVPFLVIMGINGACADSIVADSNVSAIIAYNDRGTITRSAKVEIPAGSHSLVFKGLPLDIYIDSIRAQGISAAQVTFGAVEYRRESSDDFVVPREQELNSQIEQLRDQNNLYNADKRALVIARAFLENLGNSAALRENEEIAKMELNSDNWGGAADSLSAKLADNYKADLGLDIKIREGNAKIAKLESELEELRTGQKQSYTVTLPFEADKASVLDVSLVYQMPNVGWEPVYDARLDVKTGKLELVQYGSVWQRTGEDWEDVALTLSTAQPSRGAGSPDLGSQWLSIYDGRSKKAVGGNSLASSKTSAILAAPMVAMDMAVSDSVMEQNKEVMKEAQFQAASIDTRGFVGEYKITGPASVKADGTNSKLLVGSFEVDNSLQVQIKPQISTEAYLVSKVVLEGEAPILAGQVSLFRDGAYIGQGYMNMLRPGDETQLAFGIDDNISVSRNILKDESSEAGMISKDSVLERHFVTKVKNLHKKLVEVAVIETVPVSSDERIRVEILKDSTTEGYKTDIDDIKGLTSWVVTYEPQKESSILLGWKVSWPKGEDISGL